jgi:hypothetical protein
VKPSFIALLAIIALAGFTSATGGDIAGCFLRRWLAPKAIVILYAGEWQKLWNGRPVPDFAQHC